MEANLVKLLQGERIARNPSKQDKKKEENILNLVKNYDRDVESFLEGVSFNLTDRI
jgi:hypothetical protein